MCGEFKISSENDDVGFSVLLSVYRNESPSFLIESINSVYFSQTLKPSQIILVKDGVLTPKLENVLSEIKTNIGRLLTVVSLEENKGLGAALNIGLEKSKFELVARMDTDDIAESNRFELQIPYMLENTDISVCGGLVDEWNTDMTKRLGARRVPSNHDDICRFAKSRSPMNHPSVVFRKSAVLDVGGYPPLRKAQDYALWSLLLSKGYKLANLDKVLVKMRAGSEMASRRGLSYLKYEIQLLRYQKSINFLSTRQLLINSTTKSILRCSPHFVKVAAYRLLHS